MNMNVKDVVSRTLMSSCKTTTTANDKETMVQLLRLLQIIAHIFMFREIKLEDPENDPFGVEHL
jgi:hypothetical protein